jgi:O-antigen ligase
MSARRPAPPPSLLNQIGPGALLLVVFLAPLIGGFPAGATYQGDTGLAALRCLALLAALLLAPPAVEAGAARLARLAAFAFAGLSALSLLVHTQFLTAAPLLFAALPATLDTLSAVLLFAVCQRLRNADRTRGAVILTLVIAMTLSAVVIGAESLAPRPTGPYRAAGLFFSSNFAAGFLGLCLPLTIGGLLGARRPAFKIALALAGALALGAIAATGSRAGLVLAIGGALLTIGLAAVRHRKALPIPVLGVWIAASAIALLVLRAPLVQRAATGGQEHSGAFRSWTWRGTVAMALDNPLLGTGPGTFPYRYPRYALVARTDLAHSSYLQTAAEQGFPALLAALIALGAAAITALRRALDPTDADEALLACGLLGALAVSLGRSLFDSEWSLLGNLLPLWTVAGLAAHRRSEARDAALVARVAPRAAAGIGLILAFLCFRAAVQSDAAEKVRTSGGNLPSSAADGLWPPMPTVLAMTGHLEQAAQLEPGPKWRFVLARAAQRDGRFPAAVAQFELAHRDDPGDIQTLWALADARQRAGDAAGAEAGWRMLLAVLEGPIGTIRALPEASESYGAFAHAALADAARERGDTAQAAAGDERAAAVLEAFAATQAAYRPVINGQRKNARALAERLATVPTLRARMDAVMRALDAWDVPDSR